MFTGHICKEIKIDVTQHYDGIFWCMIASNLFGVVYIPPNKSVNLDDEIFDKI